MAMHDDGVPSGGLKPMHHVADGDDVALGKTDDAAAGSTGNGSVIALLKRLRDMLAGDKPVLTRLAPASLSIRVTPTFGTTYATGQNMAGVMTLALGSGYANRRVRLDRIKGAAKGFVSASPFGNLAALFFSAAPTGTFTDTTATLLSTADLSTYQDYVPINGQTAAAASTGFWLGAGGMDMLCDAGGNLYVALVASSGHGYGSAPAVQFDFVFSNN